MSTPVVTFTAAGAVDATYRVDELVRGAFMRASAYERELSGKGVNLSAALAHASVPTAAVVVLGADDLVFAAGSPHAALLRPVAVPGATRVNTSIIDADGATTKVNAPTPPLTGESWQRALAATVEAIDEVDAGWLVVCGTLPAVDGEPADLGPLLEAAATRGVRVGADTSGAGLVRLVDRGAGVALAKPNTHELAELTGRTLRTIGDVAGAARTLVRRGLELVYVSMGADGVLAVTADRIVHAHATAPRLANTAGAGDASLAGFLVGLDAGGDALAA
ncbi:MAG: PfkB family carbohydrate kinase, partial [Microbacterium sp.]|uniref:1-phosphofructokinase family hexose kinase n=1 Tax=Microbacterium sp. TaxID=51671 RepID=UPI0039E5EBF0